MSSVLQESHMLKCPLKMTVEWGKNVFYQICFVIFAGVMTSYFAFLWLLMILKIKPSINDVEKADVFSMNFVRFWNSFSHPFKIWLSNENKRLYELKFTKHFIRPYIYRNYRNQDYLKDFYPYKYADEFSCFQGFFARELKVFPRITDTAVLPCEGLLCEMTDFISPKKANVKGETISQRDIFGSSGGLIPEDYTFTNIFLSNRNYHHIHSPVRGRIKKIERISGDLIVLRPWFYQDNPSLPAFVNERVNIDIEDQQGRRWFLSVVGGPVVNSILTADGVSLGNDVAIGEKLASFELGSTCCMASPAKLSAAVPSAVGIFKTMD